MTEGEAEELSILFLRIGALLDQSAAFVRDKDTEENWNVYRKAVGRVMGSLLFELKEPHWKRFPELEPEYLNGRYIIDPTIFEPRFYEPPERNT